ncbi:helix-turn-helix transcriptional regulator [Streptomyces sp. AP-93]|uniref:helix-turn-helix transcriptional regulator n=1 Tax=Streptomyces sp. AP-93 TaxID=2929048 RepID=UPI001FAF5A7F|nr:helix-turn-helix transcriptional regulator [Streptomyces sp. AP-93]MCJ0871134.1 helix-turn-helix domain-containing protein [Streptomyces sp. AP-93]
MPERRFDASGFRSARAVKGLTQAQVAAALGVKDPSVVSRYESGDASPPPEKLARLAALVGERVDDLFPRSGLPTLADLRCDAGMTQKDTAAVTQTGSPSPVRAAEGGRRRLAPHYVAPLAEAYGVSVEELLAAEERSFGEDVAAAPQHPQARQPVGPYSIAKRITTLLEGTAEQDRPTDAELAARGNAQAGRAVLSGPLVTSLRLGRSTHADPEVLEALAAALDVPAMFFETGDAEVTAVVTSLRAARIGLTAMAARGAESDSQNAELMRWAAYMFGGGLQGGDASPPQASS